MVYRLGASWNMSIVAPWRMHLPVGSALKTKSASLAKEIANLLRCNMISLL